MQSWNCARQGNWRELLHRVNAASLVEIDNRLHSENDVLQPLPMCANRISCYLDLCISFSSPLPQRPLTQHLDISPARALRKFVTWGEKARVGGRRACFLERSFSRKSSFLLLATLRPLSCRTVYRSRPLLLFHACVSFRSHSISPPHSPIHSHTHSLSLSRCLGFTPFSVVLACSALSVIPIFVVTTTLPFLDHGP